MKDTNLLRAVYERLQASNRLDLRAPSQLTKDQMVEHLAYVKALAHCYQVLHWHSRGNMFYGDHLLFERLYSETSDQVDSIAEKLIGVSDDAFAIVAADLAMRTSTFVTTIMGAVDAADFEKTIRAMFDAETNWIRKILPKSMEDLQGAGELTDGLENFLQGLADLHEGNVYLLSRRLKKQDVVAPVVPLIAPMPVAPFSQAPAMPVTPSPQPIKPTALPVV